MSQPAIDPSDNRPRPDGAERGRGGVAERFPTLDTVSLSGRRVRVPDDLAGRPALLLLGFQRWHQEMIDGWLGPLARLQADFPHLEVYEVPVISRFYLPARSLIDGGMVRGTPDPAARARTLTAYANVGKTVSALGLAGPENVALRLLDSSGRVVWRGRGVYDSDQLAAVRQAVLEMDLGPDPEQPAPGRSPIRRTR